jgi:hypothetical protein
VRGHRRAEILRSWARELYTRYGPTIAGIVGSQRVPPVRIEIADGATWAASTSGGTVTLNADWFAKHPDDVGACLHEFAHAVMAAPTYDATTSWLIEGIADYVRDVLGFDAAWTFAHHEPGMATAGYQTTAHFLLWLERRRPGTVTELARSLCDGRYEPSSFEALLGASLADLARDYEHGPDG